MTTKKAKSPVRRDEDFEQLDNELEAALKALESANERALTVLQHVVQSSIAGEMLAPAAGDAETSTPDAETEEDIPEG